MMLATDTLTIDATTNTLDAAARVRRIAWIDALRVMAAFAVVWLHVSVPVLLESEAFSLDWWSARIANSAVRWCVPVFIMISGALVLPRAGSNSLAEFYRRRFGRLAVPVIFWSLFFLAWTWYRGGFTDLRGPAEAMLVGRPFFHLWFLFALLGLYAVAPFLAVFLAGATTQRAWAAVLIGFLVFSLHDSVAALRGWRADIFVMWVPYVPYFLAGPLLIHCERPLLSRRIAGILFLISVSLIGLLSGLLTPVLGERAYRLMTGNLHPLVIVSAVSVVCMAHSACGGWVNSAVVRRAAPLMLGVYVVHPLWMHLLDSIGISANRFPPVFGIPACTMAVFLLSLFTCWLIACIPFGKRLVT